MIIWRFPGAGTARVLRAMSRRAVARTPASHLIVCCGALACLLIGSESCLIAVVRVPSEVELRASRSGASTCRGCRSYHQNMQLYMAHRFSSFAL